MQHQNDFIRLVNQVKNHIKEINTNDLLEMQQNQNVAIIDVREDSEWQQGHIPEATHLSKGILERDIARIVLDKAQPIVLYCGGGYRSILSAENLQKMGYENVYSLIGGAQNWQQQQYPWTQSE